MNSKTNNETILITGASGLLGSHVVKQLINSSRDNLVLLVRNTKQQQIWNTFGVKTVIGDLEKSDFSLSKELGINTVLHIAAIAGDWVDKKTAYAVNVKGTEHLVKEAEKVNCTKFIYVSTIGVYGHDKYQNASETKKRKTAYTYEKTKLEAEKYLQAYKKANGTSMDFIIVRPSSMYGEGDRYIIPAYSKYLREGKMILIGGGKSLYPIMHASDAATALVKLLSGNYTNGLGFNVYNLCDDSKISQKEFISLIKEGIGVEGEIRSIPYTPAYLASMFFELKGKITNTTPRIFRKRVKYLGVTRNVSIQKAREEIGFNPEWTPQKGVPAVLQSLEEEEAYKNNGIETSVINGIKEKDILEIIPYHLFQELKESKKN